MTDLIIYIADQIKGKALFPFFRWILNFIFCISISNAIFSKSYPAITLPSEFDYQKIWTFVVQGHFFIPFIIFLIVYFITQGFTSLFFMYFGDYWNFKLTKKILAFQIEKQDLHESIKGITEVSQQVAIIDLTKEKFLQIFNGLKDVLKEEDLEEIKEELKERKSHISDNFATLLRALIATSIYFATIPSFGWFLYLIVLLIILFLLVTSLLGYKLLDLIPVLLSKGIQLETLYLEKDNPN